MSIRTAVWALIGAAVLTGTVGFFAYRMAYSPAQNTNLGIPVLPADARTFGNWALVGCADGAGDGPCFLLLRVINEELQRVVFRLVATRGPTGNAILVVTLPANIVIPRGVTLTPVGGAAARGAVQLCRAQNCTAVVVLTDALVQELSSAQNAALSFVLGNGRNVSVNIGTAGFGAGYAAWLDQSPPPPPPAQPLEPATDTQDEAGEAAPASP